MHRMKSFFYVNVEIFEQYLKILCVATFVKDVYSSAQLFPNLAYLHNEGMRSILQPWRPMHEATDAAFIKLSIQIN